MSRTSHEYINFETWKRDWPKAFVTCVQLWGPSVTELVGLHNPQEKHEIKVEICVGWPRMNDAERAKFDPRLLTVVIRVKPGETLPIPKPWAAVTHKVRDGMVRSGKAPNARLVDLTTNEDITPPIHPALLPPETGTQRQRQRSR